ncbi:hypothetical protein NHX12_025119, partial [Muraenolepis orangiensis]
WETLRVEHHCYNRREEPVTPIPGQSVSGGLCGGGLQQLQLVKRGIGSGLDSHWFPEAMER